MSNQETIDLAYVNTLLRNQCIECLYVYMYVCMLWNVLHKLILLLVGIYLENVLSEKYMNVCVGKNICGKLFLKMKMYKENICPLHFEGFFPL